MRTQDLVGDFPPLYDHDVLDELLGQMTESAVPDAVHDPATDIGSFVVPLLHATVVPRLKANTYPASVYQDVRTVELRLQGINSTTELIEVVEGAPLRPTMSVTARNERIDRITQASQRILSQLHRMPGYDPQNLHDRLIDSLAQDSDTTSPPSLDKNVERLTALRRQKAASNTYRYTLQRYLAGGLQKKEGADPTVGLLVDYLLHGPEIKYDHEILSLPLESLRQKVAEARAHEDVTYPDKVVTETLKFRTSDAALIEFALDFDEKRPLSGLGRILDARRWADEHVVRKQLIQAVRRLVVIPTLDNAFHPPIRETFSVGKKIASLKEF